MQVEAGPADVQANYISGSGSTTIVFGYTVTASDYNSDLDLVAGSQLFTNGASIADAIGNAVSTTLPIGLGFSNSISFNQNIVVVGSPAVLSISDGPTYDYGIVAVGASDPHTFTVTNNGGVTATGMTGMGIATPFAYLGGSYPGTGGTCNTMLNASASCTIVVSFAPISTGLATDTISINYNDGLVGTSVDRNVQGTGANPAVLTISETGTFNFGNTPAVTGGLNYTFTVTNSGGVTATAIIESGLTNPFTPSGGSYPGAGGTCGATLSSGANCTIVVRFEPQTISSNFTGQINIDYNNGVTLANATRGLQGAGIPEVKPVYGFVLGDNYNKWNKYIRYDNDGGGTNAYNQDLEYCDGTETGAYGELNGCIHSGEKRKVIFYGKSSCLNLTIADSLNAFDWICNDSNGTATFYTVGLKPGKGMRDLLQSVPTVEWASNNVALYDNAAFVASSIFSTWWSNPFLQLSTVSASTVVNIEIPDAIYYANGNVNISRIMLRGAGHWSLVTVGGAEIISNAASSTNWCDVANGGTSVPGEDPLVCSDSGSMTPMFGWIEADMSGAGYKKAGFIARHWKSMRVNNSHMRSFNTTGGSYSSGGIAMIDGVGNMVSGFETFRSMGGVKLYNSTYNTFKKLNLTRSLSSDPSATSVIAAYGASNYNRFYDVVISGSANTSSSTVYGVELEGQYNNFSNLKISNLQTTSGGTGIVLGGSANNNTFTEVILSGFHNAVFLAGGSNNLFAFSTITHGLNASAYIYGTSSANTFLSLASVNNFTSVMTDFTAPVVTNRFINSAFSTLESPGTGYIFWSNASGNQNVSIQGFMVRNSSDICDGNESNLSNGCVPSGATDIPIGFTPWETSFIGSVAVGDSVNPYDTTGLVGVESSINSALGWIGFDNPYRVWGKNFFFGASSRGSANTGQQARIWDLSPASGNMLNNKSYSGSSSNSTITYTGTSCAANTVDSVKVTHTYVSGTVSFLKNAIEINDDYIGNNNGLCEDGESCTYAPHIGGAQGYGALSSNYCTMSGGIRIYGRATY